MSEYQSEVDRIREIAVALDKRNDPHNGATHFDGCWRIHASCALHRFADVFKQTKAACAEKDAELVRLTAHADFCRHDRNEAEARATAAEQERDEVIEQRDDWRYRAHLYGEHRDDYKAKLASAEQREAEKDKSAFWAGYCTWPAVEGNDDRAARVLSHWMASPSTPSPTPELPRCTCGSTDHVHKLDCARAIAFRERASTPSHTPTVTRHGITEPEVPVRDQSAAPAGS